MKEIAKKILFIVLMSLLFLPLIQSNFNFIELKELKGSFDITEKPDSLIQNWFSGDYQKKYNNYFKENLGFRNLLVRLNNQKYYSLFDITKSNSVIIGKDGFLYEKRYIDSYYGNNYIGRKKIKNTVSKLKKLETELNDYGTKLFVIIAPGKANYYPEYIPNHLVTKKDTTNYMVYKELLNKNNIPLIDFNDYFIKNKEKNGVYFYPKTGIHWSDYAIPLVIDTIISTINYMSDFNLPKVITTPDTLTTVYYSGKDMDIEKSMNLLLDIDKPKMKYYNISFKKDIKKKPKVIVISDSFYWQIFNIGISKREFKDSEFWYYNKLVYSPKEKETPVKSINTKKRLHDADFVILLSTEANLDEFPWGIENNKYKKEISEKEIANLMKYIKTKDKKWYHKIEIKAKKMNISVDSMLYLDAKYKLSQNNK